MASKNMAHKILARRKKALVQLTNRIKFLTKMMRTTELLIANKEKQTLEEKIKYSNIKGE